MWKHSFVALAMSLALVQLSGAQKLNRRVAQRLEEEVVPAYQLSDTARLLRALSKLTARMKPEQFVPLDESLEKLGLPDSGSLLAESRMQLMIQGQSSALPKPHLREILLMAPQLIESVDETIAAIDDAVVFEDPMPLLSSLEDYEALFWEIHVLENKIRNAGNLASYGAELVARGKTLPKKGFEAEQDALDINFVSPRNELARAYADLRERQLEARLDRMELAEVALKSSDSFVERIQAAFFADLDGRLLQEALSGIDPEVPFHRERLKAPMLLEDINEHSKELAELAGDLTHKSQLFNQGLHWWLRGRFGRGTEAQGLLKSMRALDDDRALFGLFMPEALNVPTKKLVRSKRRSNTAGEEAGQATDTTEVTQTRAQNSSGVQPDYNRRHYYTWNYEYRRNTPIVQRTVTNDIDRKEVVTSRTHLSHFY